MTAAGRAALPDMSESGFVIDTEIQKAFWENISESALIRFSATRKKTEKSLKYV